MPRGAMQLCIAEIKQSESKEVAILKINEFQDLVREDKIERLKEMLWDIKK
jgi:hypothetical protein